ncbi:MAG TPA: hypothetical protein VF435_16945 [Pyrinomonadaceae bacterium]
MHKAWGASPRIVLRYFAQAHEMGDSVEGSALPPASRAQSTIFNIDPGACAPGFMLPPASRAQRPRYEVRCFAG